MPVRWGRLDSVVEGGDLVISGELTGNLLLMDGANGDVLNSIAIGAPIGGSIVVYALPED